MLCSSGFELYSRWVPLRKVEGLQERARAIFRSHSETYEELLQRANLPVCTTDVFRTS